jgi:hypothetical protein
MQLKEGNSYVNAYQAMRSRSLPNNIEIANSKHAVTSVLPADK